MEKYHTVSFITLAMYMYFLISLGCPTPADPFHCNQTTQNIYVVLNLYIAFKASIST